MGFLDDLGFGEILSSVREMTNEIAGLKDDIVSSVLEPVTGLQDTVQDITGSLTGDDATTPSIPTDSSDAS